MKTKKYNITLMLSQNGLHSFEDELFFCNCAQRWDLPVFHPLFCIKLYRQTGTILHHFGTTYKEICGILQQSE